MSSDDDNGAEVVDEAFAALLPLFEGFERAPLDGDSFPIGASLLTGRVELRSAAGSGSLEICAARSTIAATAPLSGVDPVDWMGELANLAAGRLKYELLFRTRVRLAQSTPTVREGDAVPSRTDSIRMLRLSGPAGSLVVWLDLELSEEELTERPSGEILAPGSMLLLDDESKLAS